MADNNNNNNKGSNSPSRQNEQSSPSRKRPRSPSPSSPNKKPTSETSSTAITQDEVALYDRQIRLWGLEAQQRMRNSTILIAGITGLANETIKNLVLAGVGAVTLMDHHVVSDLDLGAQFFLTKEKLGQNRAQAVEKRVFDLNPRVRIQTLTADIREQPKEFFDGYNIVCLIGYDLNTMKRINEICHEKKIKFYAADTIGLFGYIFCDCQEHPYMQEIQTTTSDGGTETKKTAKSATYNSLAQSMSSKYDKIKPREFHKNWLDALFGIHILLEFEAKHDRAPIAHDSTDLEKLMTMRVEYFKRRGITDTKRCEESLLSDLQTYYASKSELSPICAVVGGLLAQDILKVLGGKDLPVKNWFVLDGRDLKGMVHDV